MAGALRPGGVLAIDICDLEWGELRRAGKLRPGGAGLGRHHRVLHAGPDRFVRDITTFVPDGSGGWRRGGERHENVLVDIPRIPALLVGQACRPR